MILIKCILKIGTIYMVKFINVSQDYGNFRALHNLSFEIKKGCLLALLGPNGAGKSTTMSIMTGFRPPLEGEVYINGINIFEHPEEAKYNIGYLAEIPPLYPDLTVREYLHFVGGMRGLSNEESINRTKEVLILLNIENREDTLIRNLSKGLKQRVGIAQSILHYPKLLILDEPTVGLEPAQLIEFRQLIRYLARETEMTVVISTHIMSEASELCDEVIILNEGKKIFEGSKEKLLLQNKQEFMYELTVVRFSDALIEHLKSINMVLDVIIHDEKLHVSTKKDISEILVEETIKFGAGVKSLTPLVTSLERVFLDLTVEKNK